jgi:cytochrome c oxidase assembly protein subunit 15
MKFFRRLTITTLVAVYILILVGGIVRSTGSGMGCPDWPKCFGSWVPPTSVEELPANYKEIYSSFREKKNIRFANYLTVFGFAELGERIRNDKNVLQEADFNSTKTWVEYANRLVGVVIGLLVFALFIASLKFWKWDKKITLVSFATLFLTGFQGWIGSFVVSTNLTPWTVTVHMLLAMVIVALLVYLVYENKKDKPMREVPYGVLLSVLCLTSLILQVVFGTQVREAIDLLASNLPREAWIESLGLPFIIHRSFSWIVLVLHGVLLWKVLKEEGSKTLPYAIGVLILCSVASGVGMAYGSVPPYLQPVHLVLATVTVGSLFLLTLEMNRKKKAVL